MIWKSAPQGKMVPLTFSPRTAPPRIGMIRRTPWPRSPATIGAPTVMLRLKAYCVESCGAIGSPDHALRQPGCQQREQGQNHQANQVGDHERQNADEDRG